MLGIIVVGLSSDWKGKHKGRRKRKEKNEKTHEFTMKLGDCLKQHEEGTREFKGFKNVDDLLTAAGFVAKQAQSATNTIIRQQALLKAGKGEKHSRDEG